LLSPFPEIGRTREALGIGVRSFRVRGLRNVVFYRQAPD
jgi:hypothetical protein